MPYTGAQKLCRTVGTSASQRSQRGRPNYRRLLLQCPLKREMHGVAFWLVRMRNAKCLLALPQVYEANVSRRRARSVAEVWQRDDSEDATVESSSRTGAFEGLSSAPCQILETSPTEEQSRAEQSRTWNVVTVGAASFWHHFSTTVHSAQLPRLRRTTGKPVTLGAARTLAFWQLEEISCKGDERGNRAGAPATGISKFRRTDRPTCLAGSLQHSICHDSTPLVESVSHKKVSPAPHRRLRNCHS